VLKRAGTSLHDSLQRTRHGAILRRLGNLGEALAAAEAGFHMIQVEKILAPDDRRLSR